MQLNWAINEPLALGYNVLRPTDGVNFSQLVQLPRSRHFGFSILDTTVSSNTAYSYEVQAYNGNEDVNGFLLARYKMVTTPLMAPTALSASFHETPPSISLWTGNDSSATGYHVLRSGDGKTFTQIASVSGNSTTTYSDTAVLSGHGYTYKVQACMPATTRRRRAL